jgi:NADH kinase
MGTLGFLLPFRELHLESLGYHIYPTGHKDIDDFAKALETVFEGKATILDRMRLSCTFHDQQSEKIGTDDVGPSTWLSL